jgi:uncharacterized protein DUF2380
MRFRSPIVLSCFVVMPGLLLSAQSSPGPRAESPSAPIVVLTTSLYTEQANVLEGSDTAQGELATRVLRTVLHESLASQILPFAQTDSLASSPSARAIAGGVPCNVRVPCALAVARQSGAPWVVMSKVSKTSNLIWLLSAQLIRVQNGELILDDSTELKGDPAVMIPIGMRQFAARVARTVRAGGVATNFPQGEPTQ